MTETTATTTTWWSEVRDRPLCGDHYAGDLVCEKPAGHRLVLTDAMTWHCKGAVRWIT